MADIDVGRIIEAGAVSLAQALPVVIGALASAGRTDLATEVAEILGPEAKVVAALRGQDAATRADLGLDRAQPVPESPPVVAPPVEARTEGGGQ